MIERFLRWLSTKRLVRAFCEGYAAEVYEEEQDG